MFRGTTPKVSVYLRNTNLKGCQVLMTISQNKEDVGMYPNPRDILDEKPIFPIFVLKSGQQVEITEDDKGGCYASTTLTQEETLKFVSGLIQIQLRWIDRAGNAGESDVVKTYMESALTNGVIEYGE